MKLLYSEFWSCNISWPTHVSLSTPWIHPCRCHTFHLDIAPLKDLFWLTWKFCIVRKLHGVLYIFEEFWYWKPGIVILSESHFCLFFYWFGDISISYHEILHEFMARDARELFLLILSPLDKFSWNFRNNLLLYRMLKILAGKKIELVALTYILDTFLCRLCCSCWVVWILPWIDRFLVGWQHVIPNRFTALYSNWRNSCHIPPDLFIPHLEVGVGRRTVHSCCFLCLTFVVTLIFCQSNFQHYDVVSQISWQIK